MFHWHEFWPRRSKRDEDLEKELRSHRDLEAEELQDSGAAPTEARYAAQRALGNNTLIKEDVRSLSPWTWLETFFQDVRCGLRQLRKSPGFTFVATLTLALGIGANTAIFTLVHAILLKSLPVSRAEELYNLGDDQNCCALSGSQDSFTLFSYPLYKEVRDHTPEFSEIAAFRSHLRTMGVRRTGAAAFAEPFRTQFVSGNYFTLFGVGAFIGRTLAPPDDQPGAPPTAVLSYRAWQTHFASDPSLVGSTVIVDRQPVTIVGIAGPSFFGDSLRSDPAELWFPLATEPVLVRIGTHLNEPDDYWLYAIGRLRLRVPPKRAEERLKSEIKHWIAERPGMSGYRPDELDKLTFTLTPGNGGVMNMQVDYADGLWFLLVVSAFVLLIACANIANLLLARGAANRLQIAVRVALGASRARLIRQVVTEGLLLALLGGAAGVLLAFAGTRAILLLAFRGSDYVPIDPTPSLPVLAFALALSILTGVIFSIAPAWTGSHARPIESLRSAGRSITENSTLPQKALLVLQATLSLVLLVGAGLATESLRRLENQQFGFQTRGRLIVNVDSDLAGYAPERLPSLYEELLDRLRRIPGVVSASLSLNSPMEGSNWGDPVAIEGHPAQPGAQTSSSLSSVSAHYFETIGTRLTRGRFISEQDTPASRHVAVINEAFARKFFPKEDPLGRHFGIGDPSHAADYEIVGIVEDIKYYDARAPMNPMAFLPIVQARENNANIFHDIQLLVAGPSQNLQPLIQRTLASVDPNLTVIRSISFDEQLQRNFNGDRLVARLTALYGLLALVLACVGLYGVAAYTVARRTSEIGVRMALGASRGNIIAMMLRVAMSPIALGLLIGLPLALAGGHAIASLLYGVKSYDLFVLGTAVIVLTASSILAAVIPARRAASIDPIKALRIE
jgi:macrolide transport system ATP-binding/permease protein